MNDPTPVVVAGGCDNALAVARSLGRRGVAVYALGCVSSLRYSRHIRWVSPDESGTTPEQWLSWLLTRGVEHLRGAIVLPCSDEILELLLREHTRVEPHFVLTEGYDEVMRTMLDKARTYELAERAGVPAPRMWRVHASGSLPAEISYPCGLKPCHSHHFRRHFGARKLFVVRDEAELGARLEETSRVGLEMLVTELIPGRDDEYYGYWTYVDGAGRPLYQFTKRKHRQFPIHFGMGTFHVSRWIPEVAELGARFLRAAGLRGPAVVEFKRDSRDGRLKLIECNARLVAPHELAERSGIDVSLLVYNHLTGRPLPPSGGFRDGVSLWLPVQDYKALRSYRRSGDLSLGQWLRTLFPAPHVSRFRWSDPLPALASALQLVGGRFAPSPAEAAVPRQAPLRAPAAPGDSKGR